ncbi:MAG: tetratricopeptide repeat protein [Myxococcaceae bacterium]|nr:tetratricopeptide repeat protein [Myxococcaceae bacterium]
MVRPVLLTTLVCLTALAGPPKRPPVDLQAMQEAMGSGTAADALTPYPSAASYAHFLRARLQHHEGNHRGALDELRLALASDDASPYLLTQMGEQYARLSELERAEAQLKRVIDKSPDYAPAQLLMGRVLYEAQKTTRARAHLSRAIRLRPADPDAYLVLTQLLLDQGKIDDAIKVVEDLGGALPGEPVGYRRLGLALAERGDAVRAERLLARAVERDPGDLEAWTTLARIHESSGRPEKALEAWSRAVERDPENRDVLLSAGRLALRLDKPAEARAYFDLLLSLGRDPESVVKVAFSYLAVHRLADAAAVLDGARKNLEEPRLHFYAGLVHERVRNWAKAIDAYDAVKADAGEVAYEARLHKAMCQSSLGQHKLALDAFSRLTEERPGLSGLISARARALERAARPKEAEALLLAAFDPRPSSDVLDALGGFYERQGRPADAVSLFSKALQKSPKDEPLLFALAAAQERKGDWQRAIDTMRTVLEANPTNAAAMNFIGYTLADRGGDLDEAERLVAKALDARPDAAAYLDSMGWVAFRRGQFDRAVELLEKATAESPDEPTLLEHLADACARAGRKPRAEAVLKRAIQVLTENPEAADRPLQRAELEKKLKAL